MQGLYDVFAIVTVVRREARGGLRTARDVDHDRASTS